MGAHASGRPLRGVLVSNSLTTPANVPLFDPATGDSYALKENDVLILYSLSINNGSSASVITLFSDIDGDNSPGSNEIIWRGSMSPDKSVWHFSPRGQVLPKSLPIKAVASAASTNTSIILELEVQE